MAGQELKVAILGTSNSIDKDGWAVSLQKTELGISVVANASLGSSHATMIPYRLPLLDTVDMDALIIDVCVNEQRAVNKNLYDLSQSTQYLDYIRGWCFSRNVTPVVLILPVKENHGSPRGSVVRKHWVTAAEKAGIPYFDGYAFVANLSFYGEKPVGSLYKDSHHLAVEAQQLLAKILADRLKTFNALSRRTFHIKFTHSFRYVSIQGDVERSTSLVAEKFRRLELGEELELDCGSGAVLGVVLNMAQTNASLCFKGKTNLLKRLDSAFFQPARAIWLVAWSLLTPVESKRGRVLITQLASSSGDVFEDNDHTNRGALPSVDHPPIVEIAGFVIRGPKRLIRLASTKGAEIDLLRL